MTSVRTSFQQGVAACTEGAAVVPASFKPYQSPKVKGGDAPVSVSVDIAGLDQLCLVAEGSMGGGHTYWGEPTLFDAAGKATRLTDLQPQVVVLGWSDLRVNTGGGPFYSIGKQRMAFGLFAHVDSYLGYSVGKRYVRFEAKAGISDTGSESAHAVFRVQGCFDRHQVQALLKGSMDDESVGDLGREWQSVNDGGTLELVRWIRTPGADVAAEAVRKLLEQCGDEPDLAKRLAELAASKKEGGEPEWLRLYFEALRVKREYAGLDDALAQLDALCGFMVSEGVPVDAFKSEIESAKQTAVAARKQGRQALRAQTDALAALRRKILFTHPAADFKDLLVDVRHIPLYYHNVDQYYEAAVDGSFVRQVTGTAADPWEKTRRDGRYTVIIEDFDPYYLPDGGFVFTSTRSQNIARCHAGRNAPAFLIHRGALDGSSIRALSWGEANELDPAVLNDGRIVYNRWEYVNRHDCLFHKLWSMKPDGTGAANFYGNLTPFPFSITEARPVPGSGKVMATATAHHSFTAGSVILIDPLKGVEGPEPVCKLTPEVKYPEAEGWDTTTYASPYPLTEHLFFAAWSPYPHVHQGHSPGSEERAAKAGQRWDAYAVYLVFHYEGKAYRELVYKPKENISCFTPIPIRPRPVPPVLPSELVAGAPQKGSYYVQNVYESMAKIEPGSVKYLRVNALFNQPTPRVPHRGWVMDEVAKGVLGTVPVNADGSAAFTIPSRTPVQLQLLDADKQCVMNMRSFIYLQDGERVSCAGCHEDRMKSPPPTPYGSTPAAEPTSAPGPDAKAGFNYVASVQPVFDRYCIRCHGVEKIEGGVTLTGAYVERETERYPGGKLRMGRSYEYFVTNPKYYKLMDRNCETRFSEPKDYLSSACGLPAWLKKHGKAKGAELDSASWERVVTWLDVNAQLYGNYSFNRDENRVPDPAGEKALREYVRARFGDAWANQSFEVLVNNGCVDESRILNAPLAVEAGGWGQIPGWKSRDDADFKKMRALVVASLQPLPFHDADGACGNPEHCRCGACWVKPFELEDRARRLGK